MFGALGFNILGDRTLNQTALIATVQRVQPAYCVVMNSTALAAALLPYTRVIYRFKGAGGNNDDDAQAHSDPAVFVRVRHAMSPLDAVLYLTNEPGKADAKKLNEWTLAAIIEAEQLGRKVCILNWATGNPEPGDWTTVAPCVQRAVAGGHLIGVHTYYYGDPWGGAMYPWHVGRFFSPQSHFGGQWVVTELGYAARQSDGTPNPTAGWRTTISAEQYAADLRRIAAGYAERNVPACIFSWPEWDGHGFDVSSPPALTDAITAINREFTVQTGDQPVTTIPVESSNPQTMYVNADIGLKIHATPGTATPTQGHLSYNQVVTAFLSPDVEADGYKWVRINASTSTQWVASVFLSPVVTKPPAPDNVTLSRADLQALEANTAQMSQLASANAAIIQRVKSGAPPTSGGGF